MYIMWTQTSNVNKEMWQPNHFVSCHESDDTTAENLSSGEPHSEEAENIRLLQEGHVMKT